ncbi:MAG TPA: PH domain-containing protein [Marmoricola sp.]|nr:PH domain-containing protein [Marmoricola sp.]
MTSNDDLVTLPHTWRPLGVRIVGGIGGVALVAAVFTAWFNFSADIRNRFTGVEIGILIALGLIALGVWFALMRCRVTATESHLVVVNGYRARTYEWAQVLAVSLRRGAPWATIDLSDGTTVAAMGIQSADGQHGIKAARQLKVLASAKSAPEQP